MKTGIYSITEAFSMQPMTHYVGEQIYQPGSDNRPTVTRIVEEDIHIEGDPFAYYVGYDKDGNRLFEYRKGTVNVQYLV